MVDEWVGTNVNMRIFLCTISWKVIQESNFSLIKKRHLHEMPFIRKVQLPDFFTSILALVYHKQDINSKENTNVVYEESHMPH